MKMRIFRQPVIAVLLAFVLFLSGCGGTLPAVSTDTGSGTAITSEKEPETAQPEISADTVATSEATVTSSESVTGSVPESTSETATETTSETTAETTATETASETTAETTAAETASETTAETTAAETTSETVTETTTETTAETATPTSAETTSDTSETAGSGQNITGEIASINGVLTVGDAAMEYFYRSDSGLQKYADNISALSSALPEVSVYAMFIPTSIYVNCPEGYDGGSDQHKAQDVWYGMMSGVTCVDVCDIISSHAGEYMYFRTDTHWTARGAYYAYRAFCQAAGFTPHELSDYEYAAGTGFLGYLYTVLKGTSPAYRMAENPDTVEKFKPCSDISATGYYSADLSGGFGLSVVNMDSSSYYAFTSGDQPVIKIENSSVSNGRVAVLTKDSYGNALVPFLCDHFSCLYVIDPRYFNGCVYASSIGNQSLDLVDFCLDHGVTDVIVEANAFNASGSGGTFGAMLP